MPSRPRPGPTIYHLADVRLGGSFPFLGQGGTTHRRQVHDTFERAVDQGLNLAPSVVLITGNLFGTQFPSRDLTEFARAQIARLSSRNIPVLIAAGPLDAHYDKHYASGALSDLDRVSIFPTAPKVIDLPDIEMSVVGASWGATPVQSDFLSAVAGHRAHQFTIGAAYLELPDSGNGIRTLRRQIAASGAAYLALGGSPARRDLSVEKVTAWCPGSPELVAADPGEGSPLLVQLGPPAPTVTPKPVAKRRYARFTMQPQDPGAPDALANAIRALADPNMVAVVHITGTSHINQFIDVNDLRARLAREFLALEIIDETTPALEALSAPYPELSVAGKLLGVARAEMERAATDEARRRAGAALRLGLALLDGRRPT
ncbi:MAG: metallophosphoesterase family protein [bacterium]